MLRFLGLLLATVLCLLAPGADAILSLQLNSTLYMVRNDVVDPLFSAPQVCGCPSACAPGPAFLTSRTRQQVVSMLYTFETKNVTMAWQLSPANASALYALTFASSNPTVLATPTPSITSVGRVYPPDAPGGGEAITDLTINFPCARAGSAMVTMGVVLTPVRLWPLVPLLRACTRNRSPPSL
jgi:hypothetical protein